MLTYRHEEKRHIGASPDAVFAILSDLANHHRLAGSDEVKSIRIRTEGGLRVGTEWDADEEIRFGRATQTFIARSTLREYEPGSHISWTSEPPTKPAPRRIQWYYTLTPNAGGTDVVERVEVDMGRGRNLMMKLPYRLARARYVAEGMRRTLGNLAERAESQL